MTQQHRIIGMLKTLDAKVDLLIEELPADKKAKLKNAILDSEYNHAVIKAAYDPRPLQQFLIDHPDYIKTQHPQLKTRQQLKDTQTR